MLSDILVYLGAIFGHWQTWLSGGGIGGAALLILTVIERLTDYRLPKLAYVTVFVVGFFLGATFLAWRDQFRRAFDLFAEKQRLTLENDTLKKQQTQPIIVENSTEVQRLRDQVQSLQRQLDDRENQDRLLRVKRGIQTKFSEFLAEAADLRNGWYGTLNQPEDTQRRSVGPTVNWHKKVASYLKTIPRGTIYVARFENQLRPVGSYPSGMNMNIAGIWDMLMSDVSKLNEFLNDPDLGKE